VPGKPSWQYAAHPPRTVILSGGLARAFPLRFLERASPQSKDPSSGFVARPKRSGAASRRRFCLSAVGARYIVPGTIPWQHAAHPPRTVILSGGLARAFPLRFLERASPQSKDLSSSFVVSPGIGNLPIGAFALKV